MVPVYTWFMDAGKEYAEGELEDLLQANDHVERSTNLHLAVSIRSFRAEQLESITGI